MLKYEKSGVLKRVISDIFNGLKRVRCEKGINCCNALISLIWLLGQDGDKISKAVEPGYKQDYDRDWDRDRSRIMVEMDPG